MQETLINQTAENLRHPAEHVGSVWKFIQDKLTASVNVILLWVLESEGSSPGRKGFKMAVAGDAHPPARSDHSGGDDPVGRGNFYGTIGGGMMEHKLVEKAKSLLAGAEKNVSFMRQYHDKHHSKDQSGMICSGSQIIAFVPLSEENISLIHEIVNAEHKGEKIIRLSQDGIRVEEMKEVDLGLRYNTDESWQYSERIDQRPVIHIIGGGHVGLALSELMAYLGFYIKIYDNRPNLNTLISNSFAHKKHIVEYDKISDLIESNKNEYVVICTFGYRDDKIVLKNLMDKDFLYIGMIGSESKVKTLFKELEDEGIDPKRWKHCFIPIGIPIFSKTTKEIAVSIAAEIIREKNKNLPTGRTLDNL